MPPPNYKDIGKNADDVLHKGQYFGLIKLICKRKTDHSETKVEGESDQETGKVKGLLETRHLCKDFNITFVEGWNTDNIVNAEISTENQVVEGLKLAALATFEPSSAKHTATVKTGFKNDCFNVCLQGDLKDESKKEVSLEAVIEQDGWVAGFSGGFNLDNKEFTKSNFALGFSAGEWEWFSHVRDQEKYNSTFYRKMTPKLDAAIAIDWNKKEEDENSTLLTGACRYELDQDATIAVSLNSKSQLGLGYQQRLREEVLLSFSALIDAKDAENGGHKVGLGLELEL